MKETKIESRRLKITYCLLNAWWHMSCCIVVDERRGRRTRVIIIMNLWRRKLRFDELRLLLNIYRFLLINKFILLWSTVRLILIQFRMLYSWFCEIYSNCYTSPNCITVFELDMYFLYKSGTIKISIIVILNLQTNNTNHPRRWLLFRDSCSWLTTINNLSIIFYYLLLHCSIYVTNNTFRGHIFVNCLKSSNRHKTYYCISRHRLCLGGF